MRKLLCTVAVLAIVVITASPSSAAVELIQIVNGLASPVFVTNAHDGTNRLFIVEQGDEIFAFGFRNPWRFSFDRTTRFSMWATSVKRLSKK